MSYTVFPSPPVEFNVGGGVLVNDGPDTVYYRGQQVVSSVTNDGSIASGASVALDGSQFLVCSGVSGRASVRLLSNEALASPAGVVIGPVRGTKPTTTPPAIWLPGDQGFVSWNYDPALAAASTALATAGTIYGGRVHCPVPFLATNVNAFVITNGSVLTAAQCFGALFNAAGVLIGVTGDLASGANSFATNAAFNFPLTAPVPGLPAGDYDVCFFFNGTTGPALARATSGANGLVNMNLLTTAIRAFTADTGRTTSMPATLGAKTASAFAYWVGIS